MQADENRENEVWQATIWEMAENVTVGVALRTSRASNEGRIKSKSCAVTAQA